MRGLLIKDILNLKKQWYIYLFLIILFSFTSYTNGNDQLFWFVIILLGIMNPITSISFDEKSKWDKFSLTLPIKRSDLILSKYIFSYITLLLSVILYFVYLIAFGKNIDKEILYSIGIIIGISIIIQSFVLPCIFKFGSEKGRLILLAGCVIPYLIVFIQKKYNFKAPSQELLSILPYVLVVAVFVVALSSILISIKIYDKKEFV